MSRAERDAAYNNTAAVADVAALHEARRLASQAARASPSACLDRRYGPEPRNLVDLFPAADPGAPCLVFLHGGYWQMNSKESFGCLGDGVRAHGWSAAVPSYTLAPEAPLSRIVGEIEALLDWLHADGRVYGIAGPVIVAGWSAGGHLAAMALRHHHVAAGLSISGLHELAPLRDIYLNERLRLSDAEVALLSPLRLPVVPKPLAVAYGDAELPALILSSTAFHSARLAAGAPGPLLALEGCNHFTILEELRRPDGRLTAAALSLLAPSSRQG
jgi:acetyl esterase/lipase